MRGEVLWSNHWTAAPLLRAVPLKGSGMLPVKNHRIVRQAPDLVALDGEPSTANLALASCDTLSPDLLSTAPPHCAADDGTTPPASRLS